MLRDEDREALWVDALECGPWHYTEFGVLCSCGRPMDADETCALMRQTAVAVEAIVARHVTAALNEAADAIDVRFDEATRTSPHDPFCLDSDGTSTTEAERNGWLSGLKTAAAGLRNAAYNART